MDHKRLMIKDVLNLLKPLSERRKELNANPKILDEIIASGVEKARGIASETIFEVREAMRI